MLTGLIQEDIMNTKERYANKLELYFDWNFIRYCDLELISDDTLDYHMFMIYKPGGELIHGWHIERIK
jgi:hypothetical protein